MRVFDLNTPPRMVLAAAIGLAMTACIATQPPPQSAAGFVATDTLSISPTIPALPMPDRELLLRLRDPNILEHLRAGDSLEIAMAQVARHRANDTAIGRFAGRMIADHTMSLLDEKALADRRGLSMQIAPGDTIGPHLFALLDSLETTPTRQFDRRYMAVQIQMHQHMLAELQALRMVASDESLKRHIDQSIPVVRAHLARAIAIVGQAP